MEVVVPDEFKPLYEVSASRPIVKIPAEVLRKVAEPVVKFDRLTERLIDQMSKEMQRASGIGLAAPQLGQLKRIIIIHPGEERPLALVNPEIIESEGTQLGQEGCLSIPGLYGDVLRADRVVVRAHDARGRLMEYEMAGLPSRVVQHEIDHLDGVLFIDKVDPATLHWMHPDEASETE